MCFKDVKTLQLAFEYSRVRNFAIIRDLLIESSTRKSKLQNSAHRPTRARHAIESSESRTTAFLMFDHEGLACAAFLGENYGCYAIVSLESRILYRLALPSFKSLMEAFSVPVIVRRRLVLHTERPRRAGDSANFVAVPSCTHYNAAIYDGTISIMLGSLTEEGNMCAHLPTVKFFEGDWERDWELGTHDGHPVGNYFPCSNGVSSGYEITWRWNHGESRCARLGNFRVKLPFARLTSSQSATFMDNELRGSTLRSLNLILVADV